MLRRTLAALAVVAPMGSALAQDAVIVTPDNFIRAESDLYLANVAKDDGFGRFHFFREPSPIEHQSIIRLNRDTLYGAVVLDLDSGPATVTLPDVGERFRSLQVIDEDHFTHDVFYDAGTHTFSRDDIGTRYMILGLRILVDPNDPADLAAVHALQDATTLAQPGGPGTFEVPAWDAASQKRVRDALLDLATTLPDTKRSFGRRGEVDPVRHLVQSAAAWGGNPEKDALYLTVTPEQNDGTTLHRLTVGEVPVDGFWSVSVYNRDGYFEANPQNAYTLNNITAQKGADGTVAIQFGGCDGEVPNCLPITDGWNYLVRLYRPQQAALDGSWTFPAPEAVQ